MCHETHCTRDAACALTGTPTVRTRSSKHPHKLILRATHRPKSWLNTKILRITRSETKSDASANTLHHPTLQLACLTAALSWPKDSDLAASLFSWKSEVKEQPRSPVWDPGLSTAPSHSENSRCDNPAPTRLEELVQEFVRPGYSCNAKPITCVIHSFVRTPAGCPSEALSCSCGVQTLSAESVATKLLWMPRGNPMLTINYSTYR